MTKLYEIASEYQALQNLEDVPPEAIADTLEGIEGEFHLKAIALVTVMRNMESDLDQVKKEIDRLTEHKRLRQRQIEGMREYLKFNMEKTNISKIPHALFTITLTKSRPMVNILSLEEIPDDYITVDTVIKPMKIEILEALKEGKIIPGAELGESERGLLIK
jgi:hypothetical protein